MANTAVVTGKLGPERTVTSLTFEEVTNVLFDFVGRVVSISHGSHPNRTTIFDYVQIATVSFSISGVSTTVTIST